MSIEFEFEFATKAANSGFAWGIDNICEFGSITFLSWLRRWCSGRPTDRPTDFASARDL